MSRRRSLWAAFAAMTVGSAAVMIAGCGGGDIYLDNSINVSGRAEPLAVGGDAGGPSGDAIRHYKVAEAAQNIPAAGSVTQSSHANENGVTLDIVGAEVSGIGEQPNYVVSYNGLEIASTEDGTQSANVEDAVDRPKGTLLYERVNGGVEFYRSVEEIPVKFGKHGPLSRSWGLKSGDIWIDVDTDLLDTEPREVRELAAGDRVRGLTTAGVDNEGYLNGVAGTFVCTLPCAFQIDGTKPGGGDGESVLASSGGYTFLPARRYVARGTWVYAPDAAASFDDYEYGAFGDGNDPFDQDNLAGLTGTATYVGEDGARGLYANARTQRNQPFNADITLTASFGYGNNPGSIWGSIDDVRIAGVAAPGNPGLKRQSTAIGNTHSGFFSGDTSMGFEGRVLSGKWGGQFHGNGTSDTDRPAAVAGTFGAAATDGSESFLGVFSAFSARETAGEAGGRKIDFAQYLTPAIEQGKAPGLIAAIIDKDGVRAIGDCESIAASVERDDDRARTCYLRRERVSYGGSRLIRWPDMVIRPPAPCC